VISASVY